MMDNDATRIDVPVNLWVETSANGVVWQRSRRVDMATETARDCRELRAIMATYVTVVEGMGPKFAPVSPWFRVVMQGVPTGTVLAVVPRKWNSGLDQYETTGGEWMITDNQTAYRAWALDLVRARLTGDTAGERLAA